MVINDLQQRTLRGDGGHTAAAGSEVEGLLIDFGVASSPSRRWAPRCLLHPFGRAPDLDIAFSKVSDLDVAREFTGLHAAAGAGR